MACIASISVGLYTRQFVSGWTKMMTGGILFIVNAATGYIATSVSGFLNAFMMRVTELEQGISVYDPSDKTKPVATSKSAARRAVLQTAISRFIIPIVPVFGPAIGLYGLELIGMTPTGFIANTLIQMGLIAMALYYALPMAIAAYPAVGRIGPDEFKNDDDKVRQAIANYRNANGQKVEYFEYNKGL